MDTRLRGYDGKRQAMYRHARDLEFEEAAKLRDEIQRIRRFGLGMPE